MDFLMNFQMDLLSHKTTWETPANPPGDLNDQAPKKSELPTILKHRVSAKAPRNKSLNSLTDSPLANKTEASRNPKDPDPHLTTATEHPGAPERSAEKATEATAPKKNDESHATTIIERNNIYLSLRKAIAQHCTGVDGALKPSTKRCLQDMLFPKTYLARLHAKAGTREDNICDLSEDEYFKYLADQKVIPVNSRGKVGEPEDGIDCTNNDETGVPLRPAQSLRSVSVQLGTIALSGLHRSLFSIARLSASVQEQYNLILKLTAVLRQGIGDTAVRGAAMVGLTMLQTRPDVGAVTLGMNGLYLCFAALPQYTLREDCRLSHQNHRVPVRFLVKGSLVSSVIMSILFSTLMVLAGSAEKVSTDFGEIYENASYISTELGANVNLTTQQYRAFIASAMLALGGEIFARSTMDGLRLLLERVLLSVLGHIAENNVFANASTLKATIRVLKVITRLDFSSQEVSSSFNLLGQSGSGAAERLMAMTEKDASDFANLAVVETHAIVKEGVWSIIRIFKSQSEAQQTGPEGSAIEAFMENMANLFLAPGDAVKAIRKNDFETMVNHLISKTVGKIPRSLVVSLFVDCFVRGKMGLDCFVAKKLYEKSQRDIHGAHASSSPVAK